jgi:nicotinamide mononucleotide (NMN) deamidase PncC
MVTYRDETKTAYLGIEPRILMRHGPVSEMVAREMAERVLEMTPEATIAASITGHLGPDAPPKLDGVIYAAVALRYSEGDEVIAFKMLLSAALDRYERQRLAAETLLTLVGDLLSAEAKS